MACVTSATMSLLSNGEHTEILKPGRGIRQGYGLPLEYWTSEGLSHVASAVGKPLHADSFTSYRRRIRFARVCVEVDASKTLVKEFYLHYRAKMEIGLL